MSDHNSDDPSIDPRDIELVTDALRAIEPAPSEPDWRAFEQDTMRAIRGGDEPGWWARVRRRLTPTRVAFGVALAGAAAVALIAFTGENERSGDKDAVLATSADDAGTAAATDDEFVPTEAERAPLDVRAALIADSGDLSAMSSGELDQFAKVLIDDAEISFDDALDAEADADVEADLLPDDVFGDDDGLELAPESLDELRLDDATLDNLFPRRPEAG